MSEKTMPAREQRRYPRAAVGVTLDIRVAGEPAARCRGVIADLSRGGMTFETDAPLEKGMTLHLKLPPALEIRGEIRRVGDVVGGRRRYGVRLHKIGYAPSN